MKGLAPANTLTGKVQRVLTDEWQTRSEIIYGIRTTLSGTEQNSVGFLLDRLVSEGRAESLHIPDPRYMSGHVTKYRRSEGERSPSSRASEAGEGMATGTVISQPASSDDLAVPGQEVGQQGGRASSVPLAEDAPTADTDEPGSFAEEFITRIGGVQTFRLDHFNETEDA